MTHDRNVFRPSSTQGGAVDTGDRLLTPGEVAALFRVDPKTVTRWAAAGRISSIRTPGGHRRFRESEVRALLEGEGMAAEPAEHRSH
jgi:excisionase family DNA binding protein